MADSNTMGLMAPYQFDRYSSAVTVWCQKMWMIWWHVLLVKGGSIWLKYCHKRRVILQELYCRSLITITKFIQLVRIHNILRNCSYMT